MNHKTKILLASCLFLNVGIGYSQGDSKVFVWGDAKIAPGGKVFVDAPLLISPGSTVVNGGNLIPNDSLAFYSNSGNDGILLNEGSGAVALKSTNSGIKLRKTEMSGNKWYYMSFPFRIKVGDVLAANGGNNGTNTIQSVYFRAYDSQKRANTNIITGNWGPYLSENDYLEPRVGYAFAYSKNSTLTEVVFPAAGDFDASTMYGAKSDPVVYWKTNIPGATSYAESEAWNCKGSPYTANYVLDQASTGQTTGFVYQYCATGTGGVFNKYAASDLSIVADRMVIPPFSMTFFKLGSESQTQQGFNQANTVYTRGAGYVRSATTDAEKKMLSVNLSSKRGDIDSDRCRLLMGNQYQEQVSAADDGPKMRAPSPEVSEIWLEIKNSSFFVSKIPFIQDYREVSLGFNAGESGDYTIEALGDNVDDLKVELLDNKNPGKRINILEEKYTFSSVAGTDNSRFVLALGIKSSTGLDDLDGKAAKVYSQDGVIHVNGLTSGDRVLIYDAMGRLHKSEVSTGDELSVYLSYKGVCIIKVTGSTQFVHKIYNR